MKRSGEARGRTGKMDSSSGTNAGVRCPQYSQHSHRTPVRSVRFAFLAVTVCAIVAFIFLRNGSEVPSSSLPIVSSSAPTVFSYRIIRKYRHDPKSFTQGLLWLNGSLYESTGLYGRSAVREVRLSSDGSAKVVREVRLGGHDFGEGLAHVGGGELLQLLWRKPDVYRYSASPGENGHLIRATRSSTTPFSDGWGLAFDGESLLVTDSGPDIFFLDPSNFELQRSVRVTDAGQVVEMVNELEVVDGEIWANNFGTDCIARISPADGTVIGWVVFTNLIDKEKAASFAQKRGREAPDIFNGIAWDAEARRLFVTGKLWPVLFEVEVVPSNMSLAEARRLCIPPRNIFRTT
eukprot:TRINITY_DN44056_c0_g1_i1.p1 TRINITY_DN44056_c0_g1~~TRINITY_DN44056_c0_g1_i1.p1  ORF type:complete len:349 (-),score=43.03 TRINITY_DN44056_c0_g1_i1:85-1131(-)